MLYTNAVYLWPFDRSSELGAAVQVTDARGDVHVETADPGLFPSYLWAFDRPAAREAWVPRSAPTKSCFIHKTAAAQR